ncbi:hypothetical protein [Porphyromonas gulae]
MRIKKFWRHIFRKDKRENPRASIDPCDLIWQELRDGW